MPKQNVSHASGMPSRSESAEPPCGENSTAVPFPIPKDGLEVIWNHITRYRGGSVTRLVTQATPPHCQSARTVGRRPASRGGRAISPAQK